MRFPKLAFVIIISVCGCLVSCSDNAPTNKSVNSIDSASATPNKDAWKNPRKGKIYSKINVVQIPLTAYENHLLGKVRTVSYKDYSMPGDKLTDSGVNLYDEMGHLAEQNQYNADGSQKWKCIYKYSSDGKAMEWDFQFFDQKEHTHTVFKYDANGNQTEAATYNDEKKLTDRETITYDEKGNDLVHTAYDRNGQIIRMETYRYDQQGNQVELVMKFGGKIPSRRMTVEYDNNGNQTGGLNYSSDTGQPVKWTQKNDPYGRAIERLYSKDGNRQRKSVTKYDQWNNETALLNYNEDGSLNEKGSFFFEYTYDEKGNVIKQTSYQLKDGKRESTDYTVTTYTYFQDQR